MLARPRDARGGVRRGDRGVRRGRAAELRAPPAAHARRPRPAAVRRLAASTPVVYAIFDLLYLDGHSLMELPYQERRERLDALGLGGPAWRVPAAHRGEGAALLEATRAQGLEGVVAKRLDSRYEPGRRTGAWIKVKNDAAPGARDRRLAAGRGPARRADRRAAHGLLTRTAGCATRGAWAPASPRSTLNELARRLGPLRRDGQPVRRRRRSSRASAVFVEPGLVAEIEFREWTTEGVMRAPSFKGLREDKAAVEVVREDRRRRTTARRGARGDAAGAAPRRPRRCSTRSSASRRGRWRSSPTAAS